MCLLLPTKNGRNETWGEVFLDGEVIWEERERSGTIGGSTADERTAYLCPPSVSHCNKRKVDLKYKSLSDSVLWYVHHGKLFCN